LSHAGYDEDEASRPKVLAAPTKLGAANVDTASLDFLWGKETNAFRNQNSVLDYEEDSKVSLYLSLPTSAALITLTQGAAKAAKRAAREARKEEARSK
jgi:hypothetical protein